LQWKGKKGENSEMSQEELERETHSEKDLEAL
jgi:hypothetical protein